MTEREGEDPELRIAQLELFRFRTDIEDLCTIVDTPKTNVGRYSTIADEERRFVDLFAHKDTLQVRMRLIDPTPVGPDNVLQYEQLRLSSDTRESPIRIFYRQGTLIGSVDEDSYTYLYNPAFSMEHTGNILDVIGAFYFKLGELAEGAEFLQKRIDREPIDEFIRMRNVLSQVMREKTMREQTPTKKRRLPRFKTLIKFKKQK